MTTALMQYLDPPQQAGAAKYHGAVAAGYDAKREQNPKWVIEQRLIEDMLDDLPAGSWVLDCPAGTGRFFGFYARKGFLFHGVDMSEDMLMQAAHKIVDPHRARLHLGDIRALGVRDKSVDAAVCCRLTRWLSPEDNTLAMRELVRVTRQKIIWTARISDHPHARPLSLYEPVLAEAGWRIHRNEAGVDMSYRILEARPVTPGNTEE